MKEFNVSVIIPVYNAEKYLKKAVFSALDQSETKEVILVEDGSPDRALEICQELENANKLVKLYRHPNGVNRGAGASRNLGLRKASQEFIAFLDADDYFLPNRFQVTKEVFFNYPDTDGVYECLGTEYYNSHSKKQYQQTRRPEYTTITRDDIPPQDLFKELFLNRYGYFSLDGLTIRSNCINTNYLFDETLLIAQDTDFILRLANSKKLRPGSIDKPVSIRGVHGENRTLNKKNVNDFKFQFSKKWFEKIKENNWPKSVNRQVLLQLSTTNAKKYNSKLIRYLATVKNLIVNLISHPWVIRKIL